MHPDIRKFWETQKYDIRIYEYLNQIPPIIIYYYIGNQNTTKILAYANNIGNGYKDYFYHLNGNIYGEEEMLKIIKLLAFT